jgi:hypothetical protein
MKETDTSGKHRICIDAQMILLLYFEQRRPFEVWMTNGSDDRRGFIRIPFQTGVEIKAGAFAIRSDSEINVSMSGLRLPFTGAAPDPGTMCHASIVLQAFDNRVAIEVSGKIIRAEPGSLAIEFTELDADSYHHLRQLIMHNTDDPEKAEQEFNAHWGIKRPVL